MADWTDLDGELRRWAAGGQIASLWWRDDDAAAHVPRSQHLLDLAARLDVPVHLAVVPAKETPALADAVNACSAAKVLQHGYAHENHAATGDGAWELGQHRPATVVLNELRSGFDHLSETHTDRFLPVLVPPWNRIARQFLPYLPDIGLRAVSLFSARRDRYLAAGLEEVSTHCDPIKWRGGPRFTGVPGALDDFVRHLIARRTGQKDATEPTGLLTHHLDMDDASWSFTEALIARTKAHPAARWVSLDTILRPQ